MCTPALNGTIWERVPKEVFVGADTLELGVNDAASHFNIGNQVTLNTLTNNGIEPGEFCREEMKRSDKLRLGKAIYKETDTSKRKRKLLRARRKQKGDQLSARKRRSDICLRIVLNTYLMLTSKNVSEKSLREVISLKMRRKSSH